jgi:hypothetical protein
VIGLNRTMTVYSRTALSGRFDTLVASAIACRPAHVKGGQGAQVRAENAAIRNLIWDPAYVLPETAQVEIDGVRWKAIPGTFGAYRGPLDTIVYRRCDVVRAS